MVALVPEQCELWRSKMDGRRFDGKVEVAVCKPKSAVQTVILPLSGSGSSMCRVMWCLR